MGRIGPTAEWNQPTHELAAPHLLALVRASRATSEQQPPPGVRPRRDSRAPIEEAWFSESGTVAIATDVSAPVVIVARAPEPDDDVEAVGDAEGESIEDEDLIPVEVVAADAELEAEPEPESALEPAPGPPARPATARASTRDPVYPVYRDRLAPLRLLTWLAVLGAAGAAAALVLVA